jgi:hypothetical protein
MDFQLQYPRLMKLVGIWQCHQPPKSSLTRETRGVFVCLDRGQGQGQGQIRIVQMDTLVCLNRLEARTLKQPGARTRETKVRFVSRGHGSLGLRRCSSGCVDSS